MNDILRLVALFSFMPPLLVACGRGTQCENTPRSEAISPDGRRKIVVFSRDCGATTGFNSQGTIVRVGDPYPTSGGTVFISNQEDVVVTWDLPSLITVRITKGSHVFKQETLVDGVTIKYP